MHRRSLAFLPLLAAFGCGGAGQTMPTTPSLSPMDSTTRSTTGFGGGTKDATFKPAVGANSPLGTLKPLAATSVLAKAADGRTATDSATELAKLDKGELKLDDAYTYLVADATAARATVGDKGASVPFPAEAKANPDGSYWIVDAETRRVYTLTGVKKEEGKPTTIADGPSADLIHPTADAAVPPVALAARADEATTDIKHALRILVKGVGTENAPVAGSRVRLKKTVKDKGLPPLAKAVVVALKKYGATLNVGDGAPALSTLADPRWTKEDAKAISVLHMADFELMAPPQAKAGTVTKK